MESAIIGIQLSHGAKTKTRTEIDRRLLLAFITEALKPIVEWVDAQDARCQVGYGELRKFYELCQALPEGHNRESWALQEELEAADRMRNVFWSEERRKRFGKRGSYHQLGDAIDMVAILRREIEIVLYRRPAVWRACGNLSTSERARLASPRLVLAPLIRQYGWIMHPFPSWHTIPGEDSLEHREQLTRAFLAALETECPTQDWLPRI